MKREFTVGRRGRPTLKASYIMGRDPRARSAYDALRRRGMAAKDAKAEIENAFEESFMEVLCCYQELTPEGRDKRKAEIWGLLAEGMPIEKIFSVPDASAYRH